MRKEIRIVTVVSRIVHIDNRSIAIVTYIPTRYRRILDIQFYQPATRRIQISDIYRRLSVNAFYPRTKSNLHAIGRNFRVIHGNAISEFNDSSPVAVIHISQVSSLVISKRKLRAPRSNRFKNVRIKRLYLHKASRHLTAFVHPYGIGNFSKSKAESHIKQTCRRRHRVNIFPVSPSDISGPLRHRSALDHFLVQRITCRRANIVFDNRIP